MQILVSLRDAVLSDNGLVSVSGEMRLVVDYGPDVLHDRPLQLPNLIAIDATGG